MTATQTKADDLQKLREMVKDIDFCMLTTIDEGGDLHSRPMSVNGDIDPDGDLWFFTSATSHKVLEVKHSPGVNVSFADPKNQRYVSISGTAELVRDRHKIEEVTPEYWENRIAVNLRHLFFAAQAVTAGMKKAGGGAIINLGSVSWHSAIDNLSVYETAKAGIEGMTRAMARDLGESNIRVNCVVPGAIRTPRQMKLWHTPEEEAKILAQQCLKQRVDPIHVTAMVLFLASADAAMCTAHNYWVDGGYR